MISEMNNNCQDIQRARENPFAEPVGNFIYKLKSIRWSFPIIPQLIQLAVLLFILVILVVLYCTIGIVFHCYAIFCSLLADTRRDFRDSDFVGKSAYAIAAGIYIVLVAPFWLILVPFKLLGRLWVKLSWFGLFLYALIATSVVCGVFYREAVRNFIQSQLPNLLQQSVQSDR